MHLNIKVPSYYNSDSYYKDKKLSYLERLFLYWDGAQMIAPVLMNEVTLKNIGKISNYIKTQTISKIDTCLLQIVLSEQDLIVDLTIFRCRSSRIQG